MKLGYTLFFLWFGHLFMDFFTGIWPIYKTIAAIDIAKAGLIIGVGGFIGEILQLFFGFVCDRGHRKKMFLVGLTLASSILLITFTNKILPCFLIVLLLMIGSGAFHPAATGIASKLSDSHRSRMILIFSSGGAIGLAISQISFVKLHTVFNGHVLIIFAPFIFLLFVLFLHKFPKQEPVTGNFSLKAFLTPIMHCKRELSLLYLCQVATQALAMAFMFLLPDLLRSKDCHSWLCMGGGHLCFVLSSAFTMIPAGFLCDKYGQKPVLIVVLCSAITILYAFLISTGLSLIGTIMLLSSLGAFTGVINPIIVSWGNRLVPESPSTVSALLMGCAWCLGNLGPAVAGVLSKLFTENPYTKTLLVTGTLLALILLLILFMPKQEKSFANIASGR